MGSTEIGTEQIKPNTPRPRPVSIHAVTMTGARPSPSPPHTRTRTQVTDRWLGGTGRARTTSVHHVSTTCRPCEAPHCPARERSLKSSPRMQGLAPVARPQGVRTRASPRQLQPPRARRLKGQEQLTCASRGSSRTWPGPAAAPTWACGEAGSTSKRQAGVVACVAGGSNVGLRSAGQHSWATGPGGAKGAVGGGGVRGGWRSQATGSGVEGWVAQRATQELSR